MSRYQKTRRADVATLMAGTIVRLIRAGRSCVTREDLLREGYTAEEVNAHGDRAVDLAAAEIGPAECAA